MGKRDTIAPHWIKALTDRDFIVVSIDYRLSPQVSLYDGPIQDTKDAYYWCRTRLPEILKGDAGIEIDPHRIVALGWSAGGHLSMMLGLEKEKPCAVLNCYGPLYFHDPSYRKPVNKIMALIPEGPLEFNEAFMDKVHEEPVLTFTDSTITITPSTGRPEVDFSQPRNAWSFGNISRGTWIKAIGIEGQEGLVDPALHLDHDFPPTCFLWGEKDEVVDVRLARDAHKELKELGVETEIIVAEGFGHAFGAGLTEGTQGYEDFVVRPVEFLRKHAEKRLHLKSS
jgi:acetyl esterase/lipase